jgi:hypothetical protein
MAFRACLSLLAVCLFIPAPAWGRTWTSRDGRTLEGDFVKLDGEQVVLSINSKEVRVSLANLSDGDQAYAKLFNPATDSVPVETPAAGTAAPARGAPALAPTSPPDPSVPDLSKSRKWTDRAGNSASGVLGSVSGGRVNLKVGSRLQTVDFQQLVDEDQDAVRR